MPAPHDLFISYRRDDKASVDALVAALQARGVTVWQDAQRVEDFASIQQAVSAGLIGARALLAWYSGRYNDSRACQWELTSAYLAAQAEGDPRRRILVVNPEASNAHVHLPELFDQLHLSGAGVPGDADAVARLADRLQAALSGVPFAPLGELRPLTPPQWLPAMGTGSTRFVGRLREMWQLHGRLQAGQAAMLTASGGKPGLALVRGAGGIGKSLMAEEYALRFGAAYPGGVYWLRAHGHPDGGVELDVAQRALQRDTQELDIAARLGIDISGLSAAQVRGALSRHFQHQGRPFLWVVDDLPADPGPEGLGGWQAPHPLGCTLFTSRTRRFTAVETIELPQLDPDEARRLLVRGRALPDAEAAVADEICALLGHHALAVDVTAALVGRRGLDQVLANLQHPDRDALELAAALDEALPNGHQRQIAATFLASIRQLDEPARELLRYAAVLAVAPIPTALFVGCVAEALGAEEDQARDEVDLAVSRLLSRSLADDTGDGAVAVHTLVSRALRFAEPRCEAWSRRRAQVVVVLARRMADAADIRLHPNLALWVPHSRELGDAPSDAVSADLLGWVARFDLERGAYASARSAFEQQVKARRSLLGQEHPDTLTSMSNLAATFLAQGELDGAGRLQEAALEASKRMLGEEHPLTLTSMSNLANTLNAQGDLPSARRLQEAVLEAEKRVLGEEQPRNLNYMNNLAATLLAQGELPGAGRLQEAVLEASKRMLGEEHPFTLTVMSNLANTLNAQGDLPGARRLQEAVLETRKRVLGEEHPDTLHSMSDLAGTLWCQGESELPSARRLDESVLKVRKRVLGEEHPDTLESMGGLANTLNAQGDLPGARHLHEAVLEARKRLLGEEHPDTLTSMNNLAGTLRAQGDLPGARRLHEAVLETRKRLLGEEHPDTLTSMNNLAGTLCGQGDLSGARRLQEGCAEGCLRSLGAQHPNTVQALANLAQMRGRENTAMRQACSQKSPPR